MPREYGPVFVSRSLQLYQLRLPGNNTYHEICVAFYAELGFSNEAAGCLKLLTQAFITCCMDTSIQMELST